MFAPVKPFQPEVISVGKDGAYPSEGSHGLNYNTLRKRNV
jgi:hypothetical protein